MASHLEDRIAQLERTIVLLEMRLNAHIQIPQASRQDSQQKYDIGSIFTNPYARAMMQRDPSGG